MSFELDFDVPVPARSGPPGRRSGSKYPFAEMPVGSSFLVPGDVKAQTVRSAVSAYMKRTGEGAGKFAVRALAEGVRVWRTA